MQMIVKVARSITERKVGVEEIKWI